jgi:hypothetical protein
MIPTPTANDAKNGEYYSGGNLKLTGYARMVPTPTASASKGSSKNSLTRKNGKSRERDRLDHYAMAHHGGRLNPLWVEWLMGWPIASTELKP